MKLSINKDGEIIIINIDGRLDGSSAEEAEDKLLPYAKSDQKIILNMEKTSFISSAGLRVLLMMAKQLATHKGKGALINLSEEIKDVMEITGFGNLFPSYKTIDIAKKALS